MSATAARIQPIGLLGRFTTTRAPPWQRRRSPPPAPRLRVRSRSANRGGFRASSWRTGPRRRGGLSAIPPRSRTRIAACGGSIRRYHPVVVPLDSQHYSRTSSSPKRYGEGYEAFKSSRASGNLQTVNVGERRLDEVRGDGLLRTPV